MKKKGLKESTYFFPMGLLQADSEESELKGLNTTVGAKTGVKA